MEGFVFGGGGNLGAVQVGMLRAVIERGIVPDLIVGCSVGAINGAAIAADPTAAGVERLAGIWRAIAADDLVPSSRLSRLRFFTRRGPSITDNSGLHRLLDRLPFACFEDAAVPFQVIATSMRTGRERWFTTGPVRAPILASAAMPAVFPPIEIDGEEYIDGAVVDNVPMARAVELGAERLIVFHVGNFERARPSPRRPLDSLLQSLSIARSYRFLAEVEAFAAITEVVVLPAIDPGSLRYNDFSRSSELIERAYESTSRYLDDHAVRPRAARIANAINVSVGP